MPIPRSSSERRAALLDILATKSFRLGDFVLASGQRSDYYIDCRITTLDAEGGRLTGLVLYEMIRQFMPQAEAVGGLTMGADPVVANVASASAWHAAGAFVVETMDEAQHTPSLLHGFLVRKAAKAHGTGRRIEGFLRRGASVVIVDDVCTTGGSTLDAIDAAQQEEMIVKGVVCLVDREQGGRAKIEQALHIGGHAAPFVAAYTASQVRQAHELHHIPLPNHGDLG
jgi:orotate phosphoribosyltransferase